MFCASCRFENPEVQKFCGECGRRLGSPAPARYTPPHLAERMLAEQSALEARASPEGERKTVTALFADIKGSMELIEDLDPEEARAIVDPVLRLIMSAVHHHGGYVAQALGDGIFALFGAPIAHEDHPLRALYAALRMQEEMSHYAKSLRAEKGLNLEIRVGVNTGEVVLRSIRRDDLRTDYVPVGHSTSLAARLQSLASPGSIVVSEETCRLTEGRFAFRALGPARIKGVSEPVGLYEVTGIGAARTRLELSERRGLARFVGRERELGELHRALGLSRDGRGQIVAVVGDAGVGKSRLLYEFERVVRGGTLVLEAFGVSHGKTFPHLPLIELLKIYFRLAPEDGADVRRQKVTAKVLTLDKTLGDTLPYLFSLLGIADASLVLEQMDPRIRRARTFDGLRRLLLRETLAQPVVVVVEDLHWVDAETEAFLDALREGVATARLLLVVSYRPEYRHGWGSLTHYAQIRVDPLEPESALEMATALVGRDPSLAPLRRRIVEVAEGNPFFMEEIVRELLDRGVLARAGKVRLSTPAAEIDIPPTVEGVLAERIDRLPMELKDLVQTAAVIGREFPWGLIRSVADRPEDELQRLLADLGKADLVYERPAFPEPEYLFKHALTREVAYRSVLIERRRLLHERAAGAIEHLFGARREERYDDLAYHYGRSGNAERAVDYLTLAAGQAIARSANREGVAGLKAALELIASLPPSSENRQRELLVQTTLGPALIALHAYGSPEVTAVYSRADELSRDGGDGRLRFSVLRGLEIAREVRGEHREALEPARELFDLAQRLGDPSLLAESRRAMGTTLFDLADLSGAKTHLEAALALYAPGMHRDLATQFGDDSGVACLSYLSWSLWLLGHPRQALESSEQAIALARRVEHPHSLAYALAFGAQVQAFRREVELTRERAEATVGLSVEYGFPQWSAVGEILGGWARVGQGAYPEGLADLQRGLDHHRANGSGIHLPVWLGLFADALRQAGRPDEAAAALDEALGAAERSGEAWWNAELHRVRGELFLAARGDGALDAAERCFREANDVARLQGARSLELRATTSLARLLASRGRAPEAQAALAAIHSWFTEGFDTADLGEAKQLLDDLGPDCDSRSGRAAGAEPAPARRERIFRREGEYWTLAYDGTLARLKDAKGLRCLSHLLRHPGRELHAMELADLVADPGDGATGSAAPVGTHGIVDAGLSSSRLCDGDEVVDARARTEYRARLRSLRSDLDEARRVDDGGRAERVAGEIEALERQLAAALRRGGRPRQDTSVAERARTAFTKAIRESIARIERRSPPLGRHLRETIRTGRFFGYDPTDGEPAAWTF